MSHAPRGAPGPLPIAPCPMCKRVPQTWEVTCGECGKQKWPYLTEKPTQYVCKLCSSGAGAARRVASKATRALRKPHQGSKKAVLDPTIDSSTNSVRAATNSPMEQN